jgi:hypothetical protein
VFVVLYADDEKYHATEWDLAHALALHDTVVDPQGADLAILSRGPSVGILASMYNGEVHLLQLTDSLRLVANNRLGQLSVFGVEGLAGDGDVTVVLAEGIPDSTGSNRDPSGLFAMSFDAAGHRLGERILVSPRPVVGEPSCEMKRNVAVISGHVYVALIDEKDQLRAVRLGRDLRTEREKPIAVPASVGNESAHLLDMDGHLVLDVDGQPDWLELSLDLATITHRPRPAPVPAFPGKGCGPAVVAGSQLLATCDCGRSTCLAWTPPVAAP